MLDKEIPGIMDLFVINTVRKNQCTDKPLGCGSMSGTLIFTLPGSVRAVEEYMTEITKVLNHLILMINNIDAH